MEGSTHKHMKSENKLDVENIRKQSCIFSDSYLLTSNLTIAYDFNEKQET